MLFVVLAMLVIVTAAALVVTYVAYPARGRAVPFVPGFGEAMARAVGRLGLAAEDEGPEMSSRVGSRG